jgi:hypothetical protein
MKMVKSLLLVSAAGVVAAPGAQAADLPVKAKPVEYVRICSLYGAGFYYIPGTDICMKIGGYVRFQENLHTGNSISGGPFFGTGGRATRLDSVDYAFRTRTITTFDTRQQTPYGTLRTYILMGFTHDSTGAVSLYATRAFIQFAGFTFGKATSFFDFASTAAVAYNAGFVYNSDTGDGGHRVAAYTAQLGNGVSATLSFEESRRLPTVFLDGFDDFYSLSSLSNPAANNLGGGSLLQDIVGNIRIDQAWGSAQVSAALHNVSAGYYGSFESNGHPEEEWGWAASAGLRINTPWIAAGNYFQAQVIYAEGATGYLAQFPRGAAQNRWQGDSVGYGFWEDAVFTAPLGFTDGQIEKTTGWSAFASYEHRWSPNWKTSVYGSYIDISHNGSARDAICFHSFGTSSAFQAVFLDFGGCNPDWSAWAVGSRTQWDIVKGLYVGLDVIYQRLHTATPGSFDGRVFATSGAKPLALYRVEDQEAWTATWRIHRDVVP